MCLMSYLESTYLCAYPVTLMYPIWPTSTSGKKYVGSVKTELGVSNKQEKQSEDKFIALNTGEINNNKRKFFKSMYKNCG